VVAFRFEGAQVFQPPLAVTGTFKSLSARGFTPELKQWMQASGADLLFYLGETSYDVLTLDLRSGFAGLPAEWETELPERARSALAELEALNTQPGPCVTSRCGYRDGLSSVHVFRTRDGLVGFYQLRRFQKGQVIYALNRTAGFLRRPFFFPRRAGQPAPARALRP